MNWEKVLTIGVEALVATGTGVAVYFGIKQATERKRQNQSNEESGRILDSLRATKETCSRLVGFTESLVLVAENVHRLFEPYNSSSSLGYRNGGNLERVDSFIIRVH